MTSLADRIRSGDPTALADADVIAWCMDDPIGRALVDRVRVLEAERDDARRVANGLHALTVWHDEPSPYPATPPREVDQ